MHELSLCQAILGHVEVAAGDRPVRRVRVRIGHLRQVVPDSLQLAWEILTEHSERAGAVLEVDHVPAVVHCGACDTDTTLEWPVLVCATCEGHDVELQSGDELEVAWIDVAEGVR